MGYDIRKYREEAKLTQKELAEIAGISRTTLSGLENGTIKTTTTDTLIRISKALNKKVSDIFLE